MRGESRFHPTYLLGLGGEVRARGLEPCAGAALRLDIRSFLNVYTLPESVPFAVHARILGSTNGWLRTTAQAGTEEGVGGILRKLRSPSAHATTLHRQPRSDAHI